MSLSGSKRAKPVSARGSSAAVAADGNGKHPGRSPAVSRLQYTLCSDYAASREIQQAILKEITRRGFNGQNVFGVQLALEEALINAIKHGNRFAAHKKVQLAVNITNQEVEIIIEDEGGGFDRSRVPDPTLQENLEKCCGRGILLIESYMSQVEWSCHGRRLRMVKKNEADVLPRR